MAEELEMLALSARVFVKQSHVPSNRITAIIKAQRGISADTALRLAKYFATTAEFWLNLQTAYDLKIARQQVGKQIDKEVHFRDAA